MTLRELLIELGIVACFVVVLIAAALLLAGCGRAPAPASAPEPQLGHFRGSVVKPGFQPPPNAQRFKKFTIAAWRSRFGANGDIVMPFAQIHQESAWRVDAISRVGAQGLGQMMPATGAGLQRNVSELQAICETAGGCPFEPKWAIKALTVLDRDGYMAAKAAKTERDRYAFMLSDYNGGPGNRAREQKKCEAMADCDRDRWFGHVEKVCIRADWACRENRDYPKVILDVHRPKYATWLGR